LQILKKKTEEEEVLNLDTPNVDFYIEEESEMPVLDDKFKAVFVGIEEEEDE
jgi:hypothetical protein